MALSSTTAEKKTFEQVSEEVKEILKSTIAKLINISDRQEAEIKRLRELMDASTKEASPPTTFKDKLLADHGKGLFLSIFIVMAIIGLLVESLHTSHQKTPPAFAATWWIITAIMAGLGRVFS